MGVSNPLEVLLDRAPARQAEPPETARVVRSDASGVWCAPLGGDTRHPIGPCRGGKRPVFVADPAPHTEVQALSVGTVVLLVHTDDGPWVARWEES